MKQAILLPVVLALFSGGCAPNQSAAPKAGTAMSPAIVEPYLKIQTALAKDNVDDVRANAGQIATAAAALGAPAAQIDTAAVQVASAANLTEAREKFGTLSDAIVTYMDGSHLPAPEGVRIAYCPMVQKPWLQHGSTLANPYYGSAMLGCGSFRQ